MAHLQFKIGSLDIQSDQLGLEKPGVVESAPHLFIVHARENLVRLFAGKMETHRQLVVRHGLLERKIVGGGRMFTEQGDLVLAHTSANFGSVSPDVLGAFSEDLKAELFRRHGVSIENVRTEPLMSAPDVDLFRAEFWQEHPELLRSRSASEYPEGTSEIDRARCG